MTGIQFDPVISLGTIIHLFVLVVTIAIAYQRLVSRIAKLESTNRNVNRWLRAIVKAVPGIDPSVVLEANGKDQR